MSDGSLIKRDEKMIRERFSDLLAKTSKKDPLSADVDSLADLLIENKDLKLWRAIHGIGQHSEYQVFKNMNAVDSLKLCWQQRMDALRIDLGYDGASIVEQLRAAVSTSKVVILSLLATQVPKYPQDLS